MFACELFDHGRRPTRLAVVLADVEEAMSDLERSLSNARLSCSAGPAYANDGGSGQLRC